MAQIGPKRVNDLLCWAASAREFHMRATLSHPKKFKISLMLL